MPLRDHFRPPLDNLTSWEEFHALWPAMIVMALARKLPRQFVAGPCIHSGAMFEIDATADEKDDAATAVWPPPRPMLSVETDLPELDVYEVRVYDNKRGRRLVAAIEIVSPANKDRPENRRAFVAKCAALLQERVSVAVVDLVTTRSGNLYGQLLGLLGPAAPFPAPQPPPLY